MIDWLTFEIGSYRSRVIVSLIFAGDGANGQGDSLCKKDAEGGGGPTRGKQQHTLDPSVSQHGCGSIETRKCVPR